MRRAVIDVGSNSVLLVVCERVGDGWEPIFEATRVTGLGEGTKASGLLGEPGMAQTMGALRDFFAKASELDAEARAAATMAARIATNTTEFLDRACRQGTPVTVLSGEEEARLGFLAVANDPAFKECELLSIVDVGGQSTEVATAMRVPDGWHESLRKSFAIGTLALRDALPNGESPSGADLLRAVAMLDTQIGFSYLPGRAGVVVALGATGTNLVTIREGMAEWDPSRVHRARLDYEEVSRAVGWLCGMTDSERAQVVGLEQGRERSIHLGALILERFLFALRAESCFVSVRGWRHAMLEEWV